MTKTLDSRCVPYSRLNIGQSYAENVCLPPVRNRSYLAGHNNGKHTLDTIYAKSVTMMQRIAINKTLKCALVNNSFNDQRSLMQSNFTIISEAWRIESSSSLSSVCGKIKTHIFLGLYIRIIACRAIRDFKDIMDVDTFIDNLNCLDLLLSS